MRSWMQLPHAALQDWLVLCEYMSQHLSEKVSQHRKGKQDRVFSKWVTEWQSASATDWVRDWAHEGVNAWGIECIKGWVNEGLSAWGSEYMRDWVHDPWSVRDWVHEGSSAWGIESMNCWVHEGVSAWRVECIKGWVHEGWAHERLSAWETERMRDWVRISHQAIAKPHDHIEKHHDGEGRVQWRRVLVSHHLDERAQGTNVEEDQWHCCRKAPIAINTTVDRGGTIPL